LIDESRKLLAATLRRYLGDGMADRAPALAYFGILSLFPLLLIGVALVRLVAGADAPDRLARYVEDQGASGALADALRSVVDTALAASGPGAGLTGLAGLLALIYGGSRAFTAAGRALDVIARRPSATRSPARRAQDVGWTLAVLAMVIVLAVLAVAGGRLLEELLRAAGKAHGLGAWSVIRWPAAALAALAIVAMVRWAAPTGARPRFRPASPGAVLSVLVLMAETIGFDFYVTSLATYNATYGAFAAGVILLLWIWLAAGAFLFGAELDAVRDERRALTP